MDWMKVNPEVLLVGDLSTSVGGHNPVLDEVVLFLKEQYGGPH